VENLLLLWAITQSGNQYGLPPTSVSFAIELLEAPVKADKVFRICGPSSCTIEGRASAAKTVSGKSSWGATSYTAATLAIHE
jgi:hypothetical protein